MYLVSKYGVDIEGNPIGRFILTSGDGILLFKILIPALALLILYKYNCKKILYALLTLFILLSIYHIIILLEVHKFG